MRKSNTIILILCMVLGGVLGSASAAPHDEQALRFNPNFAPPAPGTPAPMPQLWLDIDPLTELDDITLDQLSAAVSEALSGREDQQFFEIQVDRGHWRLVATTSPRDELADLLTDSYLQKLTDCIHSLEVDEDLSNMMAILYGSEPREGWIAASHVLVERMLANLARNECSRARSSMRLNRERLRTITRSMLSDRFSLDDYTEREIVTITDILNPLYFGRYGFWVRSRNVDFKDILVDALSRRVFTAMEAREVSEKPYATFLDFVKGGVLAHPDIATDYLIAIAKLCLSEDIESMYEPFSLGECLDARRARTVLFQVDSEVYVLFGGALP